MEYLREEYELYLEWSEITYTGSVATLTKSLLYGPAVKLAHKIQDTDTLKLDFTEQHMIFLPDPSFYIATLVWRGINYLRDDVVELHNCTLEHHKVGSLRELSNDNFFIIDCAAHEESIHAKNLLYTAWVLDANGYPLGA